MLQFITTALKKITASVGVFISILLFTALLSYSPQDPSALHTGYDQIHNAIGKYGAFIADPIIQALGYSVLLPLGFVLLMCLKMLGKKNKTTSLWRSGVLFLAIPLFATLLSFMDNITDSDFDYTSMLYSGGFLGYYIKSELLLEFDFTWVLSISAILSFIAMHICLNITHREYWSGVLIIKTTIYKVTLSILSLASTIQNYFGKSKLDAFTSINGGTTPIFALRTRSGKNVAESIASIKGSAMCSPNGQYDRDVVLPALGLLQLPLPSPRMKYQEVDLAVLQEKAELLLQVLQDFGIRGEITGIYPGPVVTLYELLPAAGTKSSRVIGLADDIARSMSAISTRISVIPGKNAMGIELPNKHREIVYLRELFESPEYRQTEFKLPLALGKNIAGIPVIADISKMPHLLVAGTTGSGKSVAINTMIISLLYKHSPKKCRFVMIDPKMLELSIYEGIPHLIAPVVTDPKKAVVALKWVIREMESRYRAMSVLGVRNIHGYNKIVVEAIHNKQAAERQVQVGFDPISGNPIFETISIKQETLPYIIVIVDEMADLMLVSGKEIEAYVQRLAQMARAAGIHIIMATQRPSVDVVTGVIKANFPTRIAFQVTSKIDSRTILGEMGAEQLLGMGDMLYMMPGGKIERVHGAFVEDHEVEAVTSFLREQGPPQYVENFVNDEEDEESAFPIDRMASNNSEGDALYKQALEIVTQERKATTSYLQRCLKIGYNKAASLIERMEKEGVVSTPNHTGKREVLQL
ncbi:DNA translocase FtsK [Alphaproteobacteria bacterium]